MLLPSASVCSSVCARYQFINVTVEVEHIVTAAVLEGMVTCLLIHPN